MSEGSDPRVLTNLILSPLSPSAVADRESILEATLSVPRVLSSLAVPRLNGGSFRLTDHEVRRALAPSDRFSSSTSFAWSARTSRRALGLSALRSQLSGTVRSPTDGVRSAIADGIRSTREGERLASPMDRWLARLPVGGRAVVEADAVTWATRLWCALDWSAFGEGPVIGRDHWWDSPHSPLLAIRSRAEVRSVGTGRDGRPFSVHLVVLGGPRRSTIRCELSVVAMVEALVAPRTLPPGRIVGWWPDSGHLVNVEVDQLALAAGVAAASRVLSQVEAPQSDSEPATRAAA